LRQIRKTAKFHLIFVGYKELKVTKQLKIRAASILATTILLTSTAQSVAAEEFTTKNTPAFSFAYPRSWTLSGSSNVDGTIAFTARSTSDQFGMVSAEFIPGLINKPGPLNQCQTVDEVLTAFYEKHWAVLDTGRNKYPYVSVTHDAFMPGRLGGEETFVSINYQEAYKNPSGATVYLTAIPRKSGMYVFAIGYMDTIPNVKEWLSAFQSHFVMTDSPLGSKDYCNYLGK
jgi:hypothetical protein